MDCGEGVKRRGVERRAVSAYLGPPAAEDTAAVTVGLRRRVVCVVVGGVV